MEINNKPILFWLPCLQGMCSKLVGSPCNIRLQVKRCVLFHLIQFFCRDQLRQLPQLVQPPVTLVWKFPHAMVLMARPHLPVHPPHPARQISMWILVAQEPQRRRNAKNFWLPNMERIKWHWFGKDSVWKCGCMKDFKKYTELYVFPY